jgi:hypothetical protein
MDKFTELSGARIIRENVDSNTVLVEWQELAKTLQYWFPRKEVAHIARLGKVQAGISVLTTSYLQALKESVNRQDDMVDF